MTTYTLITGVEVLGKPEKVPARSGGNRTEWRVPVRYLLEDGGTLETGDRYGTRRDAQAKAGEVPDSYFASFNDAGEHIGFRQRFTLFGGAS